MMRKTMLALLGGLMLACLASAPADAAVQGREISYMVDGQRFTGYLARDDAKPGPQPGVIVVHEWWGMNAYARHRADMLAALGYTAFALDMYGSGKVATHPADAQRFMQATMAHPQLVLQRFLAAMRILKSQPGVENDNIAAIGYCMGGGIALNMARAGLPLKGVAVFHGSLGTANPVKPGQIRGEVAAFIGADDPFVPAVQVQAFEKEMQNAGVRYSLKLYPDTVHSFTNPDATSYGKRFKLPLAYNEAADKDSWRRLQVFLHRVFTQ